MIYLIGFVAVCSLIVLMIRLLKSAELSMTHFSLTLVAFLFIALVAEGGEWLRLFVFFSVLGFASLAITAVLNRVG